MRSAGALVAVLVAAPANAAELVLQSRLLDAAGTPLQGANTVTVVLGLEGGGTWTDTFNVNAEGGYVAVVLGAGTQALTDEEAATATTYDLSVGGVVLINDAPLRAVPRAVAAQALARSAPPLEVHSNGLRWDDGTYAASCKEYRWPDASHAYSGLALDGAYWIDPAGGSPQLVTCDMNTDGGGWTRSVLADYGLQSCPSQYNRDGSFNRCNRNTGSAGWVGHNYPVHGLTWQEVRGTVRGYQFGSMDAFHASSATIDQNYVDGVSISTDSPRIHLWTLAVGNSGGTAHIENCPGIGGTGPQAFVGADFFCDTGFSQQTTSSASWSGQPLWDTKWFRTTLDAPTTSPIQVRLMSDQPASNEDVAISYIELWVR